MKRVSTWACSGFVALLLAGCGGGGDDPKPPPGPYAVGAALGHILRESGSWTLHGTAPDGQAFQLTVAFAPLPAALFPVSGGTAARSQQTFTVQRGNGPADSTAQTVYFDDTTLGFVGWDFADSVCSVATTSSALPASADLGAGGPMFDQSDLDGCAAGSTPVGTTTNRWTLEADGATAVQCWNMAAKDLNGQAAATLSTCIGIAPDGTPSDKARFTLTAGGTTLTARNF